MIGERFGRLLVLRKSDQPYVSPKGRKLSRYDCICDCGKLTTTLGNSLKTGHTKSCGCYYEEMVRVIGKKNRKWPEELKMEYKVWKSIKQRCTNSSDKKYTNYGGRGINICSRWKDDFGKFIQDMGPRPSDKHTIERVDVNKGYGPDNCVWKLFKYQARNRRKKSTNTSGVTGVYWHKRDECWLVVCMNLDGSRHYKSFTYKDYGDGAKDAAIKHRYYYISKLNEKGAGYQFYD